MATRNNDDGGRAPGVGIDAHGGDVTDPTKNVLDVVRAESKYQDSRHDSLKELLLVEIDALKDHIKILSESTVAFQNAQRTAETSRIDQLAQTRQEFQNTIRDMLAESVRTTSTLVSDQLKQIQATFDSRVSKLEAYQFTQAGKSSVADPALSDALARMTSVISSMQSTSGDATKKMEASISSLKDEGVGTASRGAGRNDVTAWIAFGIMFLVAIATPIIAIIAMRVH